LSKKEDAQFQAWIAERESSLSNKPEKLQAFKTLLAEDDSDARELFRGGLREADYYRRLNEHQTKEKEVDERERFIGSKEQELRKWWEENAPKNEQLLREKRDLAAKLEQAQTSLRSIGLEDEAEKLKSIRADAVATPNPSSDELKALKQRLEVFERGMPGLLSQLGDVTDRALRENFKVKPSDIIAYSSKNNVPLNIAFDQLTADERAERAQKDQDEQKIWT
jgi:hypothetical protein